MGRTGAEFDTGTSAQFNGTSQYVGIGNPSALNFTGQITISAWIKPMSGYPLAGGGVQEIIEHGDQSASNTAYVALCLAGGSYEIVSNSGTSAYAAASPVPAGDLNTWVHLAGVYNGTSWLLYRDGVQVAQTASPVGAVAAGGNWSHCRQRAGQQPVLPGRDPGRVDLPAGPLGGRSEPVGRNRLALFCPTPRPWRHPRWCKTP